MKRFRWPLQRLLEVTNQRELALRSQLLSLTQELARCHGRIMAAQAHLRGLLEHVGRQADLHQRIRLQELLLSSSQVIERQLRDWRAQLRQLQQERAQKTPQLVAAKRKRQTLERLQAQALERYRQEVGRLEQGQLDEAATVAFARRALRPRAEKAGVN
jgi:flagellar biosynthesis chaperone FliJ